MEQLSSPQPPAESALEGPTRGSATEAAFTGNPVTLGLDFESSNQATSREIGQPSEAAPGSNCKMTPGELDHSDIARPSGQEPASHGSQTVEGELSPNASAAHQNAGGFSIDPMGQRLLDEDKEGEVEALWAGVERLLVSKLEAAQLVLQDYGIGEGDEDSESEEGLLWKALEKSGAMVDFPSLV